MYAYARKRPNTSTMSTFTKCVNICITTLYVHIQIPINLLNKWKKKLVKTKNDEVINNLNKTITSNSSEK